ncbi:MAG: fructosamine kinase family protein [Nannocystales bacterium]
MRESLDRHLTRVLGSNVTTRRRVSGGDTCDAWRVQLTDGRTVFAKEHTNAGSMFDIEAFGLQWLAQALALRVPEVVHTSSRALVLEFVESGTRSASFDETLGRGLAQLHALAPPSFGLARHGVLASLPQDNTPEPDWATFYGVRRLVPMLALCVERGHLPAEARGELDALLRVLPQRLGPPEPPARLHGDLWSGNVIVDARGAPVLVDPAVYGGHRETDLAMMRLFGGFSPATFAAYEEAAPLEPESRDRVELHQLYPVLVHAALFGGHYGGAARRTLTRYA